MATLSVLGQLMGGLVPPQGAPAPYDAMAVNKERAGSQTALIALEELTRQQASEAQVRQFMAQHPELFMGQGQPMGPPQTVPGGQDLSRFATQGQPPAGSTLGQPGPPPPGQDQLMALMRANPDAALAVQGRMQKMQDMRLERTIKETEYVGRVFQGVTDDASYGPARAEIARVLPQYAAQLPPTYSKPALQPYLDRAQTVKDTAVQRLESRKLDVLLRGQDVELAKAQQTGGKVNYQTDAQGNIVVVPEYASGTGPVQSRPVLGADGQPIKSLEGQKLTTQQQEQVRGTETGLRTQLQARLAPFYEVRDAIGRIEQSAQDPTATGDLALITSFMKMIDPTTGVKDAEFRNAASAGGILDRVQGYLGQLKAGTRLDDTVRADFLQRSRMLFEQYSKDYGQVRQQFRDLSTRMGGNPDNVDLEMGSTVAQPPGGGRQRPTGTGGQGNTGTPYKPVDQMTRDERAAEIAAIKARGGMK